MHYICYAMYMVKQTNERRNEMTDKITINNRQYAVTYEQNSYYMVYEITASGKWYAVTDIEERDSIVDRYLAAEQAEYEDLMATQDDASGRF
jgi:hypothetical protein